MTRDQFNKVQDLSNRRIRLYSLLNNCRKIKRMGCAGTITFRGLFDVVNIDVPNDIKTALIDVLIERAQNDIDEVDKQIEEL